MSIISNLSVQIIIFLTIERIFTTANINNATTNDTDFVFLVTGGYRPPKHTLTKYLVSLRGPVREYWGDNHFCGGSIISPRIILTAAHCLTHRRSSIPRKARDIKVVAKTTNRLVETGDTLELSVEEIRVHPSYKPQIMANDIGIAKVAEDIDMDGSLSAIIPLIDQPVQPTTHCTVLGWGRIFQNGPMAAEAIYADVDIWLRIFCSVFPHFNEGMLCVANLKDIELDACVGDSGGPLICDSKLVGIVSYGIGCASGIPGVYSDVWYYRKWIRENHCNRHADNGFLILFATFMCMVL